MRLPDDAEVSDELWDEVIDIMKQRVGDKVPAIRGFAIRALSRFANDGEDSDIAALFLDTLPGEPNSVCPSKKKKIMHTICGLFYPIVLFSSHH